MLNLSSLLLFLVSFGAATIVFSLPNLSKKRFSSLLSFSGAYLFCITVVHILPELFHTASDPFFMGIMVLIGFYIQLLISTFSSGVEHGHLHAHSPKHTHSHGVIWSMFFSIWIHSFLEGSLLVHPHAMHPEDDTQNLLIGLLLHKIPESVALASVIIIEFKTKLFNLFLVFLYAIASPLGLQLGQFLANYNEIPEHFFTMMFALVAGNFLHISTVIFFETEPKSHSFKGSKLLWTSFAALAAITVELLLK